MRLTCTGERTMSEQVEPMPSTNARRVPAPPARLALSKRVLDAGCGAGYGAAELSQTAQSVVGADSAAEAIAFARAHYLPAALPNSNRLPA